jgi:hypothetical protein
MKVISEFMKNIISVLSGRGFLEAPAKLYG